MKENELKARLSRYRQIKLSVERRRTEEAVAAAQPALGAGEDEAEEEGEVGQAMVRSRSLAVPQGFLLCSQAPDQTQDQGACDQVLKAARIGHLCGRSPAGGRS
jgi:hypothetical protein